MILSQISLSWKVNSDVDETHGDFIEIFWAKASSMIDEEFSFKGTRNEYYSFNIQSFNPQKQGEVVLEDYVIDCIEAFSINLLLSMYLLKWSRRFNLSIILSKDLKLKVQIFKNLFQKPPHPMCFQCQLLKRSPNVQDEVTHVRFIYSC